MKTQLKDFTDLRVWQSSRKFAVGIYTITRSFPKDEIFGLTSQLRRASVSVASNIAEGFGRFSTKEKILFYNIAQSSLIEVQNQLMVSRDVGFIPEKDFQVMYNESVVIGRMLSSFVRVSRTNIPNKPRF